jgi:hypothetical protein
MMPAKWEGSFVTRILIKKGEGGGGSPGAIQRGIPIYCLFLSNTIVGEGLY